METESTNGGRALSALTIAVVLWIAYTISLAVYNVFFHPLSHYPGPLLRKAFQFPYVFQVATGYGIQYTHQLHIKYGPIVRTSPDSLSFISAEAWKDIYGFQQNRQQIPKDWKRCPPVKDAIPILFSDDVDHARMRKLMSHAFSDAALREQIPLISSHLQNFVHEVQRRADQNQERKVNLTEWLNYLAFDVVTDLSFGESIGALKRGKPSDTIENFLFSARMFWIIPMSNEYLWFRAFFLGLLNLPAVKRQQEFAFRGTREKVERRTREGRDRKDFMTYILRHNDEKGMNMNEILGSTSVLVNAGGETTSAAISATIYYMLKHPHVYAKAKQEVRRTYSSADEILATAPPNLIYLNAVIQEMFRIYSPSPGNFARRTDRPTVIDGHLIPPNTSVGVHQFSAGRSPANFFEPDRFMPERWLKPTPMECRNDSSGAVLPFAIGPRNCLGKNLAYLEIRTTLALVLWRFELELCPESYGWPDRQTYNIVWNRGPLYVKVLPRE